MMIVRSPDIAAADPVMQSLTWFAAYSSVGRERRAVAGLLDAGMEAYCPMATRWIMHARKRERVQRPLFPRYLFVGLQDPDMWGAAKRVDGIEQLIRAAGTSPAVVPAAIVERLRAAEALGQFDDTVKHQTIAPFKVGQPVRVIAGPLSGFVAKVVAADPKGRVRLLLTMLGGERTVSTTAEQLEGV